MQEDRGLEYMCENIKEIRLRNGLTKKEMAKLLGIGVKALTQIEGGNLPPRQTDIKKPPDFSGGFLI